MQKKKKDEEEDDPSFITPETRRILRIADILVMDADEYEMEQHRKLTMTQCTTPRRILSRWFSALKRRRPTKVHARSDKGGGNQIARDDVPPHTRCSTNGLYSGERCGVDSSSSSSSFNLGVACGLLCVIAAGKSELNKMVELRSQMELILQNAKQELGIKQVEPNNNEINFTSFSTNFQQQASTSASGSQFSLQSVVGNQGGGGGGGDEYVAGMDELEAELHAELERLQLQLDSENSFSIPRSPQQRRLEEIGYSGSNRGEVGDSASTDYSDEMLWGCGVAPLELERKLHQVLETRQEERVKELEDALECAEKKLQEKEIEVSWWRDTARLMSGHESELPYSRN